VKIGVAKVVGATSSDGFLLVETAKRAISEDGVLKRHLDRSQQDAERRGK